MPVYPETILGLTDQPSIYDVDLANGANYITRWMDVGSSVSPQSVAGGIDWQVSSAGKLIIPIYVVGGPSSAPWNALDLLLYQAGRASGPTGLSGLNAVLRVRLLGETAESYLDVDGGTQIMAYRPRPSAGLYGTCQLSVKPYVRGASQNLGSQHWANGDRDQAYALVLSGSTGTYTLTLAGHTTAGLPVGASSAAAGIQTALQGLTGVGAGNALVYGPNGGPYKILFTGALANQALTVTTNGGTGGAGAVLSVSTSGAIWIPSIPGVRLAAARVRVTDACDAGRNLLRIRAGQHAHAWLKLTDMAPVRGLVVAGSAATVADATARRNQAIQLTLAASSPTWQSLARWNSPTSGPVNGRKIVLVNLKSSQAAPQPPDNLGVAVIANSGSLPTGELTGFLVPYDVNHVRGPASAWQTKAIQNFLASGGLQVPMAEIALYNFEGGQWIPQWLTVPSYSIPGAGSAAIAIDTIQPITGAYSAHFKAVGDAVAGSVTSGQQVLGLPKLPASGISEQQYLLAVKSWGNPQGLAAPTAAPTLAQATGGNLTLLGTYLVAIAWATPTGETTIGPTASITLTGANNAIAVTRPAAPTGATNWGVYISQVAGGASLVKASQSGTQYAVVNVGTASITIVGTATPPGYAPFPGPNLFNLAALDATPRVQLLYEDRAGAYLSVAPTGVAGTFSLWANAIAGFYPNSTATFLGLFNLGAPTATIVGSQALPATTVTVPQTITGANLVGNTDAAVNANNANADNGTLTRDAGQGYAPATTSFKETATTNGPMDMYFLTASAGYIAVTPGQPYGFWCVVKPSVTMNVSLSLSFFLAGLAAGVGSSVGAPVSCPSGSWTLLFVSGIAPATAAVVLPAVSSSTTTIGQTVNVGFANVGTSFAPSGAITVVNNAGQGQVINYTGLTATTFTGCTGGTGTLSNGAAVLQVHTLEFDFDASQVYFLTSTVAGEEIYVRLFADGALVGGALVATGGQSTVVPPGQLQLQVAAAGQGSPTTEEWFVDQILCTDQFIGTRIGIVKIAGGSSAVFSWPADGDNAAGYEAYWNFGNGDDWSMLDIGLPPGKTFTLDSPFPLGFNLVLPPTSPPALLPVQVRACSGLQAPNPTLVPFTDVIELTREANHWELQDLGSGQCPPLAVEQGQAARPYLIEIQARCLGGAPTISADFAAILDEALPRSEWEAPGLTSQVVWDHGTRADNYPGLALRSKADGSDQGQGQTSSPFMLEPGGAWLELVGEVNDGTGKPTGDAVNAEGDVQVDVVPLFNITTGQ